MRLVSIELAERLLDHAERLLAGEPASCRTALRERAATFLARQALEELLHALWQRRAPGLEAASVRAQLACMGEFVRDAELVGRVRWAWGVLSSACHAGEMGETVNVRATVPALRALGADAALR